MAAAAAALMQLQATIQGLVEIFDGGLDMSGLDAEPEMGVGGWDEFMTTNGDGPRQGKRIRIVLPKTRHATSAWGVVMKTK